MGTWGSGSTIPWWLRLPRVVSTLQRISILRDLADWGSAGSITQYTISMKIKHTHRYIYIYVCMYVYAFTNVYISICLFVYLSINQSINLSINQSTNQSIYTPAGHRSPVFSVPCARSLQECCKHFVVLRHAGNGHWPQLVAPIACLSFVYLWFNGRYGRMLYNATYRYTLVTWSLDIHTQICSADPVFFRTFGQVHESLFTALLDPWLRSEQELGPQSLANTLQLSFGRTCPLC